MFYETRLIVLARLTLVWKRKFEMSWNLIFGRKSQEISVLESGDWAPVWTSLLTVGLNKSSDYYLVRYRHRSEIAISTQHYNRKMTCLLIS